MSQKSLTIIGWVLSALLAILFLWSASMKIIGSEEAVKGAGGLGLSPEHFKLLGIIEFVSVILFLYPRTGVLGTLLLTAYLGGAIATHLEHGQSVFMPSIIEAVLWIAAILRFPELRSRLFNHQTLINSNSH